MGLFDKIFGSYSDREVKRITPIVDKIDSLGPEMEKLSDEELKQKTFEFKDRYAKGESLDDMLPEAFAVCREASTRVLGMKHYREQLIGGTVLHQGRIAEMKTGEGKTLVATLPVYLNAIAGKGVHVITVNDYLATRDKEWMGQLYEFLGLTTGVIVHGLTNDQRREAYNADITYGTNNEFGFDYLRDNMVIYKEERVQRPLHYCIVDEVDSILIDEARTPLIISGAGSKSTDLYKIADFFVKKLREEEDYTIDEKAHAAMLTDKGVAEAEKAFGIENYADANNMELQHHITQALKANYVMKRDKDYMVKDDEIAIVDEFTGRLMEGRRYSDGLHQAIEAKEGVKVQRESKTLATITFQNYFRMYTKLAGMTGTALTEETEFREIYGLDVVVIPTHRPVQREDHSDLVFKTAKGKYDAIVEEIIETHKTGQPVLVGTTSIEKSEYLSSLLKKKGVPHKVLNARYHEQEAEIVSHAGELGNITIATNMAGRGTDIKLGEGVLEVGGLKIIGTERHESRRIDNQLRGRAGRQGDPGVSRFFVSIEDEIIKLYGGAAIEKVGKKLKPDKYGAISSKKLSRAIENAQKGIEGKNFEQRKDVLKYDNVIDKQRKVIYAERDKVLDGVDLTETIMHMVNLTIDEYVEKYINCKPRNYFKFYKGLYNSFMPDGTIIIPDAKDLSNEEIAKNVKDIARRVYDLKSMLIGESIFAEEQKKILLKVVDNYWVDHIDLMDQMRQSVGLVSVAQKDPVKEYTIEAYNMFETLNKKIRLETLKFVFSFEGLGEEE